MRIGSLPICPSSFAPGNKLRATQQATRWQARRRAAPNMRNKTMKNLKIGTRLGIAFAALLVLMSIITGIGVWRLQSVGNLTDFMVNDALAKERLVNSFYKSIELNVGRIVAAAKNADPVQQKFYKDQIVATIARNNEYVKQMEAMITDDQGKALLNEINERRKVVIANNTAVFKDKDAGNEEGARKTVQKH